LVISAATGLGIDAALDACLGVLNRTDEENAPADPRWSRS
jgi:hypothetical protein